MFYLKKKKRNRWEETFVLSMLYRYFCESLYLVSKICNLKMELHLSIMYISSSRIMKKIYVKMFTIFLDLNTRSNYSNFTFTLRMPMIVANQGFPVTVPEGKIKKNDWLRLEKLDIKNLERQTRWRLILVSRKHRSDFVQEYVMSSCRSGSCPRNFRPEARQLFFNDLLILLASHFSHFFHSRD